MPMIFIGHILKIQMQDSNIQLESNQQWCNKTLKNEGPGQDKIVRGQTILADFLEKRA